ncbi:MAG: hypothetical protein HRU15_09855 [Planctomycetes bacterium]|nr:hypothetical protein [Planctomycetota bacterium]
MKFMFNQLCQLCVVSVLILLPEIIVAEEYAAEGTLVWEDDAKTEQVIRITLQQTESKKKYTATCFLGDGDNQQELSGTAKGSFKSGTFKLEFTEGEKKDGLALSIKGSYRSGDFKGKVKKMIDGKLQGKADVTWVATDEFAAVSEKKNSAPKEHAIAGNYNWSAQGNSQHTVRAVFTASGQVNAYDVKFYFKWGNDQRVYSGTAQGSVVNGALEGEVTADNQPNRHFVFKGTSTNGSFAGDHHEMKGTWKEPTGKITWKPES